MSLGEFNLCDFELQSISYYGLGKNSAPKGKTNYFVYCFLESRIVILLVF